MERQEAFGWSYTGFFKRYSWVLWKICFHCKILRAYWANNGIVHMGLQLVLLFMGAFLVGWETVKMIQQRINHQVKKTVKDTYDYTKGLPKKSYNYTKNLHKKLTK